MSDDPTLGPDLRSWVPVPEESDFPIQNLPYGVFHRPGTEARIGVAIGEHVLDLAVVAEAGLLEGIPLPPAVLRARSLNPLAALGRSVWAPLRRRVSELLRTGGTALSDSPDLVELSLLRIDEVRLLEPVEAGDYIDFYSSLEHATNLGRMLRPDAEPLMPNWRHLPVGYHGRSSSIVVSGTPVRRPFGQLPPAEPGGTPSWDASRMLDIELEVGAVVGPGNPLGTRIPVSHVRDHLFGFVLVNDWSARDIQRWEYQPLGPFLGKSFATSVSPWVVTLDALESHRVAGPPQDPLPLDYLRVEEDWAFDVELEVALASKGMTDEGRGEDVLARTNLRHLYWSVAQQLAHATANGANLRPGDLCASGTISGSEPGSYGSMIELTWRGQQSLTLADGSERTFLRDGDTVALRGWAPARSGRARIGFGEVRGTVLPAVAP